ncbi:hypothetical protein BV22DRAFT_1134949 [Leucogyrophana mollusca]|uniref:Uncharacterized protein n=1 Tax=Leucogyrophana mollusca TaxID=85980 RepID=A0ACB8AXJ3_9AGAM|nr:hypothetical protein BV22DRAFT_1134949 [Leucogyrophana mollusca]
MDASSTLAKLAAARTCEELEAHVKENQARQDRGETVYKRRKAARCRLGTGATSAATIEDDDDEDNQQGEPARTVPAEARSEDSGDGLQAQQEDGVQAEQVAGVSSPCGENSHVDGAVGTDPPA